MMIQTGTTRGLVAGRPHLKIRDIEISDLLHRDPVRIDYGAVKEALTGKRILVTGAGGSIGSQLVSQIKDEVFYNNVFGTKVVADTAHEKISVLKQQHNILPSMTEEINRLCAEIRKGENGDDVSRMAKNILEQIEKTSKPCLQLLPVKDMAG